MPSTNRLKFLKQHNLSSDTSLSLSQIAKLSNIPLSALNEVFKRGIGAYRTNPESVRVKGTFKKDPTAPLSMKLSAEQWAYARVYAFVMKTKKVYYGADNDIRVEHKLK
jgi:hypothetical protein